MTDAVANLPLANGPSPSLAWRMLLDGLGKLHRASNMTVEEVAKRVRTSRSSVDRWLSGGKRNLSERDVEDLCEAYGYGRDDKVTIRMVGLAQAARQRAVEQTPEWMSYNQFGLFVDLEQAAGDILTYEPLIIPGLLQTAEVAEAAVRATGSDITDEGVTEQVQLRMARQAILDRDRPTRLHAILDEGALWRVIGGAVTMNRQLAHLIDAGRRPNVTIQVVPFSAGPAAASVNGGFVLMHFNGVNGFDGMVPIAYQEATSGAVYRDETEDTGKFRRGFDRLAGVALDPEASAKMITAAMRRIGD